MKIGLDIGYSATKAVSGGRRMNFPSVVGTPDKARFAVGAQAAALVLVEPEHVLVGAEAVRQSRFVNRREDRRWIESLEWYTLALAALSELTSATRCDLQIVTGLPVAVHPHARGENALFLRLYPAVNLFKIDPAGEVDQIMFILGGNGPG